MSVCGTGNLKANNEVFLGSIVSSEFVPPKLPISFVLQSYV